MSAQTQELVQVAVPRLPADHEDTAAWEAWVLEMGAALHATGFPGDEVAARGCAGVLAAAWHLDDPTQAEDLLDDIRRAVPGIQIGGKTAVDIEAAAGPQGGVAMSDEQTKDKDVLEVSAGVLPAGVSLLSASHRAEAQAKAELEGRSATVTLRSGS